MGIKRKILLGFVLIGSLLFLSGLISSMELVRLNRSTSQLLEWSSRTIELTKNMLDLAQEQNTALLMSVTDSAVDYRPAIQTKNAQFEEALNEARSYTDSREVQNVAAAYEQYSGVISLIPDSLGIGWFNDTYRNSYYELTKNIKEFMMATHNRITESTAELENNAYRASMVGIIALGAGICLVFIFYYLLNIFFIAPVLSMNKALKNYFTSNMPFKITIKTEDEMLELRDYIAQLIMALKNQNKE